MSSLRQRYSGHAIAHENISSSKSNDDDDESEIESKPAVKNASLNLKAVGKTSKEAEHVADKEAKVYKVIPAARLRSLERPEGTKRRYAWIFILGGLFGLTIAALFADRGDILDLTSFTGVHLESLYEVLPAGFVKGARELQQQERETINYDSFSVGLHAKSQGIEATHPVIMIPGVISTALESWSTAEESRQYFRKRLWGSWSMMRALVMDKNRWKRHLMLHKETGLDPPGVKLRAAQGFDATDFFITGYWIWNKILENLATVGYDPTNAFTAAYDWRLSYMNHEKRDQYYTRLKSHIEIAVGISGKKVVLLSHSMGSQVLYYFLHWVEADGYGNGGKDWVEKHVDSWINISGCMLGAAKGLPAVLSGEMKDTAQLNAFAVYGLEKFLSRHERADLFRAMPGISSILPIGGNLIWGDMTSAPDDKPGQNVSYGRFLNLRQRNVNNSILVNTKSLTVEEGYDYLLENSEDWYRKMVTDSYSIGVAHTSAAVEANQKIPRKWINPLETRLPRAPNLKIYCIYGVGKPTERSYYYREEPNPTAWVNQTIDTGLNEDDIDHGVVMGEGDGTVNLLSMGYMCAKGWKMKRYNPAGVRMKTIEMPHEPGRFAPRGGPNTGDHVDILGRSSLNDIILRVAGGRGELVEENVVSNISQYADKVKISEEESRFF